MDCLRAIQQRRSIRRFKQKSIPYTMLLKLIDAARLAPSAGNFQPWEFVIVDDKETAGSLFAFTRWAVYFTKGGAPEEGRRPVAYIVVVINKERCKLPAYAQVDLGAAIENILLAATGFGLASCWFGSIDKENIAKLLSVPENISVEYVVALGYPDEKSSVEVMADDHKYYKDSRQQMHVPKRSVQEITHRNKY